MIYLDMTAACNLFLIYKRMLSQSELCGVCHRAHEHIYLFLCCAHLLSLKQCVILQYTVNLICSILSLTARNLNYPPVLNNFDRMGNAWTNLGTNLGT